MIAASLTVLIAAPLVALVAAAVRFGLDSVSRCPPRSRLWRLVGIGAATTVVVLADISWIVHSLHWATVPLLTNVVCGALAVLALVLLRDREPTAGDHS